ncbi:ELMO/CED-12 family protein [Zea mays]|uniref:ELMO/CED-12 family protein n=1 Tax=Zea mays TaxID=4577 RepID=A0A1D6JBK4_MAIZE|nr:ELMO/CED-12 family protein [Zea mays]
MEQNAGSFLAVRRLSGGAIHHHRHHSSPAEVVGVSTAWLGKGLSCVCAQRRESDVRLSFDLSPIQEECLNRLQNRIEVQYDGSNLEHQKALEALWRSSFPGTELLGLVSDQWKEMGWQGKDPSTDFRGGGFISLENLLYFSRNYPKSFQELLRKQNGDRALWEYPFAVAGVNITFMLIQMLDLQAAKPTSLVGAVFLNLLLGFFPRRPFRL